jgi:hypothetical protein
MSVNPEVDGIVTLPVHEPQELESPPTAPPAPPAEVVVAATATPARSRPRWLVPTAIAVIGLLVSGTLGYFVYSTIQQRDKLQVQLTVTKATLASTQSDLADAKTQAASKKVIADYVAMYIADEGKVQTDYANIDACDGYSACRTSAQQLLTDMQQFQADRKAATVPSTLASTDSSLGDALSAGIAGDQELIDGMDNNDMAKVKDGYNKIVGAMLTIAKAQTALGTELK